MMRFFSDPRWENSGSDTPKLGIVINEDVAEDFKVK
jgi:hypothetical protein